MDILYAWIAAIASGFSPLIIKASSKSLVTNPWLFSVLWVAFRIPLVAIAALVLGAGWPRDWTPLVLLGLSASGFYLFNTLAIYKLDVTTVSPLFSLRAVFAALLGIVVLHESVTPLGIALMIVIVATSPLAAYNEKLRLRGFLQPSALLVVAAMASLALAGFFANISVAANGLAATLLWQDFLALLILLPSLAMVPRADRQLARRKLLPFTFLGITGFAYVVAATLAYSHNLALSSIIVSLPLSMIFAYFLSKKYSQFFESHTANVYIVRFLGAAIMVVCAMWLSFL